MKTSLSTFIKISILAVFLTGINACNHVNIPKDLSYLIPYIESDPVDLNISKLFNEDDLIPLYADQYGKSPAVSDLNAEFRAAWSSRGLWIFCQLTDDQFYVDSINPLKSDALEIFLAPARGSNDIIQLTILPCNTLDFTKAYINNRNYRTTGSIRNIKVDASASSKRIGTRTFFKVMIPLNGLGIKPALNTRLSMQVYVNDSDKKNAALRNQLQWYPVGHSYSSSFAMYNLVFTKKGMPFPKETSKCYIKDNDSIKIFIYSKTLRRTKLLISNNNDLLIYSDTIISFPVTFSLPAAGINPDFDTLRVFLNDNLISVHDLFNVPRVYEKLQPPGIFEREIRFFEAQDRLSFPPENAILFIGSSSIKGWYNLKDYFPDKEIIHRGFGGSTAADALKYINRIVINYKPSRIVYYEGDNDIARAYSKVKIIAEIDSFISIVHKNLPGTEIFILPPKPSFARYHLWDKYLDLNSTLRLLSEKYSFVSYIDIVSPMFDEKGKLLTDIFLEDSLHLNEKGYQIWGKTIRSKMGYD